MDSSVSETYGNQEWMAFNGHSGCTRYHPLFCFNQFGDLEQSLLAEVTVPRELLQTILERIGRLRAATAMSG